MVCICLYSCVPSLAPRVEPWMPFWPLRFFFEKMPVAIVVHLVSVCHLIANPYRLLKRESHHEMETKGMKIRKCTYPWFINNQTIVLPYVHKTMQNIFTVNTIFPGLHIVLPSGICSHTICERLSYTCMPIYILPGHPVRARREGGAERGLLGTGLGGWGSNKRRPWVRMTSASPLPMFFWWV